MISSTNKHEATVPIIIVPGLVINSIQATSIYGPINATVPQLIWDRRNNEIIYLIVPRNPIPLVHCDIVITINIAFDEIIGGDKALSILNAMAGKVERILLGTEGEARRIGAYPLKNLIDFGRAYRWPRKNREKEETATPNPDEALRRMLGTAPQPRKPKTKEAKPEK